MKSLTYVVAGMAASVLWSSQALCAPDPNPDPNATVIYLRTSCAVGNSDAGESPMENCFEDMSSLNDWVYSRSNPTAKLLIDIGPGEFGTFRCEAGAGGGDLTFRGAGIDKTQIVATAFGGFYFDRCGGSTRWAIEDMSISGTYGVVWLGKGSSTWTNVVIQGTNGAWYEQSNINSGVCSLSERGKHMFFSSRLVATGSAGGSRNAYINRCGDDWFWGSEIAVEAGTSMSSAKAIFSQGSANRMHFYGSNIKAEVLDSSTVSSGTLTGIEVLDGAEVHTHGVGIDVVAKPGWTATALSASNLGEIHASESSYFFGKDTQGITIKRIENNNGHVHAPFLWGPHSTPPAIQSAVGADIAVVTSGTSDNRPHMVIYVDSATCPSNWYDTTDKVCH